MDDARFADKAVEPEAPGTLLETIASVDDIELGDKAVKLRGATDEAPCALLDLASWVDNTGLEGKAVEVDEAPGILLELAG